MVYGVIKIAYALLVKYYTYRIGYYTYIIDLQIILKQSRIIGRMLRDTARSNFLKRCLVLNALCPDVRAHTYTTKLSGNSNSRLLYQNAIDTKKISK